MNVLDVIVAQKRKEIAERKISFPVKQLEQRLCFSAPCVSLKKSILQKEKSGIIAEFKRKSPSKGMINATASVGKVTKGYVQAGASALSILTDHDFFGGCNDDLSEARKFNPCPILRKDFTIDEYQIIEAKSIGADAILLIAAILNLSQLKKLSAFAHSIGVEVLMEVHAPDELHNELFYEVDLIGINNRNLKNLEVNLDVSRKMVSLIPTDVAKISESGISDGKAISELRGLGFDGFLMGENFMKQTHPEIAANEFISKLEKRK